MRSLINILESSRVEKAIIIVVIATSFITLWATLYVPLFDGDIWFHLLYGKYIFQNLTITPDHTIYSWTPTSNDSIYCTWIGQVIYYLLYEIAGYYGIIAFRYIAASSLFISIMYLSVKRKTFYNPIVWFSSTLCILILEITINDKPESISFVLMVLLVLNWYQIKLASRFLLSNIYFFPILIIFWVNTHGAFIFGCIFLLCVGVGETLNQVFLKDRCLPRIIYNHLVISLLISFGCIFITPYGYEYVFQLVKALFENSSSNDVSYVQAYIKTFEFGGVRFPLFADTVIILISMVFVLSVRNRIIDFVPVLGNLVFAFLFTRYLRTTFLWVPVFSLSIVYYANCFHFKQIFNRQLFTSVTSLISMSLCGWIIYQANFYPSKGRWLDFGLSEYFCIEEELDFIEMNYPNLKLGNNYDHGAYILWKAWPGKKVMIDARYFPYKKIFNEYLQFEYGINIEKFINDYPFDIIEIKHSSIVLLEWFARSKEWQLVFYGKGAAIFTKASIAKSSNVIRGHGIKDIREYGTALALFDATLIFKDWLGADIIISAMKKNFTHQYQKEIIEGLENIKLASKMYDQHNYQSALEYISAAIEKNTSHSNLYAAILLMKAIEDWNNNSWQSAIEYALKSWQAKKSFAADYNIAMMSYQLEKLQKQKAGQYVLEENIIRITPLWRDSMIRLSRDNVKLPSKYISFAENARKIINGKLNYSTTLAEPDWK